jgi:hypothetical protein
MGGDFSSKGQQDCAKGIYALAGKVFSMFLNKAGGVRGKCWRFLVCHHFHLCDLACLHQQDLKTKFPFVGDSSQLQLRQGILKKLGHVLMILSLTVNSTVPDGINAVE